MVKKRPQSRETVHLGIFDQGIDVRVDKGLMALRNAARDASKQVDLHRLGYNFRRTEGVENLAGLLEGDSAFPYSALVMHPEAVHFSDALDVVKIGSLYDKINPQQVIILSDEGKFNEDGFTPHYVGLTSAAQYVDASAASKILGTLKTIVSEVYATKN